MYELLLRNSNCSLKLGKTLSYDLFFPPVSFLMAQMQSKSQVPSLSYLYKRSHYKKDDVISVKVVVSNITAFRFTFLSNLPVSEDDKKP